MRIDPSNKFLIVGLGLLGGCYAMALKKKGFTVYAITKEQCDIDYAISKIDAVNVFLRQDVEAKFTCEESVEMLHSLFEDK